MKEQEIAGRRLVEMARPFLRRTDRRGLATELSGSWSPQCLVLLLDSGDPEVVRVALIALGVCGNMTAGPRIAKLLHHNDFEVVSAAEDALWSLWLRDGGADGQEVLSTISQGINAGQTIDALAILDELIRSQPRYAEAYHQRSQALYLEGDYRGALRDARRSLELNPIHFGAMANQAHALSALGQYGEALAVYERVLEIHPFMPGIREAVAELRSGLIALDAHPAELTIAHGD
jgi:tetratricopeptide (TPR) repeat protein